MKSRPEPPPGFQSLQNPLTHVAEAAAACEARSTLGESPVWDERRAEVFWCDIPAGVIHRLAPGTGAYGVIHFDGPVGCLGLCETGRLVVACGAEILLVDPDGGGVRRLHRLAGLPCPGRFNDGRVGPDGALWVGTMHDVETDRMAPVGVLWRFTASTAEAVATGFTCFNGAAFSPDGRWFWHSDSVQKWIRRHPFDPATGALGEPTLVARPDEATGRPDGAAIDVDGIYWSAGVSAGVLNGFDADGRIVRRIGLPVPHPTMPCFGGKDYRTLFVTSHRKFMDAAALAAHPLSGALLTLRMERPGLPSFRFNDGDV